MLPDPVKPGIPEPCPCGRPLAYAACCGRYHAGSPAPDAESLMRSRYSAYVHGLEVKTRSEKGDTATVEFVARCRIGGRAQRLHEVSRFLREDGRWYYVDGVID